MADLQIRRGAQNLREIIFRDADRVGNRMSLCQFCRDG